MGDWTDTDTAMPKTHHKINKMSNLSPTSNNGSTVRKKVRGRPRKTQFDDDITWPNDVIFYLIDLWRDNGVLYNPKFPNFHSKEEHTKAIKNIQAALSLIGFNVPLKLIHGKLGYLKSYFCKERCKMKVSSNSDNHSMPYVTKWRFYDKLMFLDRFVPARTKPQSHTLTNSLQSTRSQEVYSLSHGNEDLGDSGERPVDVSTDYNEQMPVVTPCEPATETKTNTEILDVSYGIPVKSDDDVFADLIGRMIKKVEDGEYKDMLKLSIQQMIVQATYNAQPVSATSRIQQTFPYPTMYMQSPPLGNQESPITIPSTTSPDPAYQQQ